MTLNPQTVLILSILLTCTNLRGVASTVESAKKPNIIIILADDLSYQDVGAYGQQSIKTPHIDRLATSGVRFTQAYSASPVCASSRCSLLTGLHSGHSEIRDNGSIIGPLPLSESALTIVDLLKENGYQCGFIGKWGLGGVDTSGAPWNQGFNYSFGFLDQLRAHTYYPEYLWENDQQIRYPTNERFDMNKRYATFLESGPVSFNEYDANGDLLLRELEDPRSGVHSQDSFDRALDTFIERSKETPFFIYYAPQIPHGPLIVDHIPSHIQHEDWPLPNKEWAAMVERLDQSVGNIVEKLEGLELLDNTIIFFASDNGYSMSGYLNRGMSPHWPDDPIFKNKGPFKAGKDSLEEGGCRIPLIAYWGDHFKPQVNAQVVWLPDLFATICDFARIPHPPATDGITLSEYLTGGAPEVERCLYFQYKTEQAVRKGPFYAFKKNAVSPTELYHLGDDPLTAINLAEKCPEMITELESVMKNAFIPSPYYWNPSETWQDYTRKKAEAENTLQSYPSIKPNHVDKLPWE